jgi:hypothetical protein
MKPKRLLAVALAAAAGLAASAIAADNPFGAFKGKIKPGMYEYKGEMDMGQMPGMPPGMATKQPISAQHCITQEMIERGGWDNPREREKSGCEVKNFKMSGNTATYQMECKQPAMTADNTVSFGSDSFKMEMKMNSSHGGQVMKMTQRMEGKYLGPCPAK